MSKTIVFYWVLFVFNLSLISQEDKELELQNKIKLCKEDTNKVNLILKLANYQFVHKTYATDSIVIGTITEAINLSKKLSFAKGYVQGCNRAATFSQTYGNYEKALVFTDSAIKEAKKINNDALLCSSLNSKGNVYSLKGDNAIATVFYFKALDIAINIKDTLKQSSIYNGLGKVFNEQGNFQRAISFHTKSLKLKLKLKDSLRISHSYVNLGDAYNKYAKYDSSNFFYSKALQIQTIKGNKVGQGYSYNGIAYNYYGKKRYLEAISYFRRAAKIIDASDDISESLNGCIGLGKAFLKIKVDSAYKYLMKAKLIAEKIDKRNSELIIYEELTNYYEIKERPDSALKFYKLYSALKDTISGVESTKKIAAAEYNYQIKQENRIQELEEKQNELLHMAELGKQRTLTYSFIAGFIVILIFATVMFKSYKQKSKSNKIIIAQKEEVELKNVLIEEKQKEILDSIHYAKRIQTTLLAHREFINEHVKENFVLFRPKDIVSGDFYWATRKDDLFYFAVCDSTGHGVPGAFMSLLSITFLNEAINERNILQPNEVFNYVRKKLIESVSRDGQKDGFDGILICQNTKTKKVTYAAANNSPVVISSESFEELPSDRMPVGHGIKDETFKLYQMELKPNHSLYLYTDGYADQFGGPKGKKLMYKRLNELLVSVSNKSMANQEAVLNDTFNSWKGDLEQIDDVCIIGLKI